MKSLLFMTSSAIVIAASLPLVAFAQDSSPHSVVQRIAGQRSVAGTPRLDLLGDPIPASAARRTIRIGPDARYVNVVSGETVKFVVGDRAFGWAFDGPIRNFDLSRVAPAGMLDHRVASYVSTNLDEIGGP